MADYPKLIVLTGPEEGQEVTLNNQETITIGRADDNGLVLEDSSVSRHHLTITKREDKWFVRDEKSSNGSSLDDEALRPGIERELKTLDLIKLGVYELRYAEREFSQADVNSKKPAVAAAAVEQVIPKEEVKPKTEDVAVDDKKEVDVDDGNKDEAGVFETNRDELGEAKAEAVNQQIPKMGKGFIIFIVVALLIAVVGILIQFAYKDKDDPQDDIEVTDVIEDDDKVGDDKVGDDTKETNLDTSKEDIKDLLLDDKKDGDDTETTEDTKTNDPTVLSLKNDPDTKEDTNIEFKEYAVFLEVKSEPLPATIHFLGKRLGIAPIKENITIKPKKKYEIVADFQLKELNDVYRKKVSFVGKPTEDVIEVKVDAEIGVLKISKLPRRSEFYLEGYYAYDKLKANPVKITDIIYGKPIYLPYGKYVVELREKTKVAGSENKITQIRFQREYTINKSNRSLILKVSDKDLNYFPAVIKSVPNHADVFYGEEKVGTTPFEGKLPLGPHKLKIVKEGYFPETIDINMNMNSVYHRKVTLKTSKIGELINDAKEKLRLAQNNSAINLLVDALKYGGSRKEKAEAYFLLGDTYIKKKQYSQALPYFKKAKAHELFKEKASLGLIKCYHGLGKKNQALTQIVQVMANFSKKTPPVLRNEAKNIFKRISPVNSVIYIYTEPSGASVFVNDKPISQDTPLILSDLNLGNYRIRIEKAGYDAFKTKQNLSVSDFVMVKVKLKPEKL
jgi:pSer/pThr/pTyr-binding forkhead associated (FHA) protein/tetratricopeptide (TPR) repeat protein